MKINIYGIGRSGTKAAQLYVAYQLAKHFEEIDIVYEPYFWANRKGVVSYEGIKLNNNEPNFANFEHEFSNKHIKYLDKLLNYNEYSVNKFIRGVGRINAINDISKPNLSILIIRSAYDVISSLAEGNWDFYSYGYEFLSNSFVSNHYKIINEFNIKYKIDIFDQSAGSSKSYKTLIYWYYMNKFALDNLRDTIVIPYKNLAYLPTALNRIPEFKDINFDTFNRAKFNGIDMSSNKVIKDKTLFTRTDYIKYNINIWLYLLNNFASVNIPYLKFKLGSKIKLSSINFDEMKYTETRKKIKLILQKDSFIDELNAEIMEKAVKIYKMQTTNDSYSLKN